jgi:hypothetical protein
MHAKAKRKRRIGGTVRIRTGELFAFMAFYFPPTAMIDPAMNGAGVSERPATTPCSLPSTRFALAGYKLWKC